MQRGIDRQLLPRGLVNLLVCLELEGDVQLVPHLEEKAALVPGLVQHFLRRPVLVLDGHLPFGDEVVEVPRKRRIALHEVALQRLTPCLPDDGMSFQASLNSNA